MSVICTEEIGQVIEKYSSMVYKIAYSRCCNRDDADDVFQEVFIKLMSSKKDFRGDEHIKAWLIKVTVNMTRKFFKKKPKTQAFSGTESYEENFTEGDDVFIAISRLPEVQAKIVYLRYVEDYDLTEIASLLKISYGNVRTNLTRAREKLRGFLKDDDKD